MQEASSPAVVSYPGGEYHTPCAVHLHARLSRSASAPARWRALLATLAAADASTSLDVTTASAAGGRASSNGSPEGGLDGGRPLRALLADLDRVLARGDPALDDRLLEVPNRAYGGRAEHDALVLPEAQ